MPNETLRKTEEKKITPLGEDFAMPISFDVEKFNTLIKLRRTKLETIKALIPLKTYHLIQERIEQEQKELDKIVNGKKEEVQKKQQNVGLLPKTFFELRTLKPKSLRID